MNPIHLKRALKNSALLALVVFAIALYQGETWLTAVLSFGFSALIIFIALLLSYQLSDKLTKS